LIGRGASIEGSFIGRTQHSDSAQVVNTAIRTLSFMAGASVMDV
jgi:hypothetical protein